MKQSQKMIQAAQYITTRAKTADMDQVLSILGSYHGYSGSVSVFDYVDYYDQYNNEYFEGEITNTMSEMKLFDYESEAANDDDYFG